ncbi:MAG: sugar phosphate nucleotidyltransferase [Bacteroidales bacterium]
MLCALQAAEQNDWLLTLGITLQPARIPYGYIQFDEAHAYRPDCKVRKVKTFTEKPNHALAESFLQKAAISSLNAGIFIWSIKSILKAFEMYLPDLEQPV